MSSMPIEVAPRLTETEPDELAMTIALTKPERDWYKEYERFADIDQLLGAAAAGRLVEVTPDDNIMPIYRLRNPDVQAKYPPFLLPSSRVAMAAIGRLWRQGMDGYNIGGPEIRLPATSFARTEKMQDALVASGALATPGSTHCVGAAFDIDASSYYSVDLEQGIASVPHPGRDKDRLGGIARFLANQDPTMGVPMRVDEQQDYDSRVAGMLLIVAADLHSTGMINRIVEFSGTENQCIHIAPNPDVTAEDWRALGQASVRRTWMG